MKRVWYKHYPSDWRSDPRLNQVSRAARSFWLDCIGLMQESDSHRLEIDGNPMSVQQLSRALGDNPRTTKKLLSELTDMGVCSIDSEGFVISRRILRDRKKAEKDILNGRMGGNPALKIRENSNKGVNPEVKAQNQKLEPEVSTNVETCARERAAPRRKTKRGSRLPEGWAPDLVKARRVMDEYELTREEMNFCYKKMEAHAHANERVQKDWDAAYRNWVISEIGYGTIGPKSKSRKVNGAQSSIWD